MRSKRAYHHGNLREALVAAGLKEVARHGPDAFSLREVARRAGVSAPAVYRHFADKEALLAAIAGECSERMAATMAAAVAAAPPDALSRFRATGIAYVRFAVEHPEHFRAMGVAGLFQRLPADQLARALAAQAVQREELARAQAAGEIARLPLDDVMLAATALVHGVAHQIVEGQLGKVDAARAEELAIAATEVLGQGLFPRQKK